MSYAVDNLNGTVTYFGAGVTDNGDGTYTLTDITGTNTFDVTTNGNLMATITPVQITAAGADLTPQAASAGGDTITVPAGTRVELTVINGSGSAVTVTFTGTIACSKGALHNTVYTVAANKTRSFPVPTDAPDPTTGIAAVAYSSVTSVTVYAEYQ